MIVRGWELGKQNPAQDISDVKLSFPLFYCQCIKLWKESTISDTFIEKWKACLLWLYFKLTFIKHLNLLLNVSLFLNKIIHLY